MAVLFGFMSLAHGPVMAFAHDHAPQTQHQPTAPLAGQHVQHAGHHGMNMAEHGQDQHHAAMPICYANGCFVAVAPLPVGAPASVSSPLQQLAPARAQTIVSAEIDPAVPPPRLQA